jgi:hypothetical protein
MHAIEQMVDFLVLEFGKNNGSNFFEMEVRRIQRFHELSIMSLPRKN